MDASKVSNGSSITLIAPEIKFRSDTGQALRAPRPKWTVVIWGPKETVTSPEALTRLTSWTRELDELWSLRGKANLDPQLKELVEQLEAGSHLSDYQDDSAPLEDLVAAIGATETVKALEGHASSSASTETPETDEAVSRLNSALVTLLSKHKEEGLLVNYHSLGGGDVQVCAVDDLPIFSRSISEHHPDWRCIDSRIAPLPESSTTSVGLGPIESGSTCGPATGQDGEDSDSDDLLAEFGPPPTLNSSYPQEF